MKWVAYVACVGEMRNVYKIFVKKPRRDEIEHLEVIGFNEIIILKLIKK
jgi:hypothetical protein